VFSRQWWLSLRGVPKEASFSASEHARIQPMNEIGGKSKPKPHCGLRRALIRHLYEQGRVQAAIELLAHNLTTPMQCSISRCYCKQRTNRYAEAADYWRRYLTSDCQSEWAAWARRSLKFCEMQINLIASA
jgi:hypothetical protein